MRDALRRWVFSGWGKMNAGKPFIDHTAKIMNNLVPKLPIMHTDRQTGTTVYRTWKLGFKNKATTLDRYDATVSL